MADSLQYWVGFSRVPGIGPVRLRALLDYFGDIQAAWNASPATLLAVGLDRRSTETLVTLRGKLGQWVKLMAPGMVDRIARKAIEAGR